MRARQMDADGGWGSKGSWEEEDREGREVVVMSSLVSLRRVLAVALS